jgi:hypothetical protein
MAANFAAFFELNLPTEIWVGEIFSYFLEKDAGSLASLRQVCRSFSDFVTRLDVYTAALTQGLLSFDQVPIDYRRGNHPRLHYAAVCSENSDPSAMAYIPKAYRTKELCLEMVRRHGPIALPRIPTNLLGEKDDESFSLFVSTAVANVNSGEDIDFFFVWLAIGKPIRQTLETSAYASILTTEHEVNRPIEVMPGVFEPRDWEEYLETHVKEEHLPERYVQDKFKYRIRSNLDDLRWRSVGFILFAIQKLLKINLNFVYHIDISYFYDIHHFASAIKKTETLQEQVYLEHSMFMRGADIVKAQCFPNKEHHDFFEKVLNKEITEVKASFLFLLLDIDNDFDPKERFKDTHLLLDYVQ